METAKASYLGQGGPQELCATERTTIVYVYQPSDTLQLTTITA